MAGINEITDDTKSYHPYFYTKIYRQLNEQKDQFYVYRYLDDEPDLSVLLRNNDKSCRPDTKADTVIHNFFLPFCLRIFTYNDCTHNRVYEMI
jgi:hypothetical protein